MQQYVLDEVEELYYVNDIYVMARSRSGWQTRRDHQRKAMSTLKLLAYVSQLAMELAAIQPKQFEQISQHMAFLQIVRSPCRRMKRTIAAITAMW